VLIAERLTNRQLEPTALRHECAAAQLRHVGRTTPATTIGMRLVKRVQS